MHSNSFTERALDILAPCYCALCGLPSRRGIELCLHCEGELPWLTSSCRQCALPLARGADAICGRCLSLPPAFDRCIAACAYTMPISGWVHAGKYHGDFASLRVLAYLLRRAVASGDVAAELPDLVIPMPLHWRRRWRRGFNQALELCREIARHPSLSSPMIDTRLARRIRATPAQRSLGLADRQRNLRGAFKITRSLQGETIAIVDDVLTSGASAHALATALKARGAGTVSIWCCARTPEPSAD